MGSLFIVISIPSAEYEKTLWVEKNLSLHLTDTSAPAMKPNKSFGSVFSEVHKSLSSENFIGRSLSDDSIQPKESLDSKERARAHSAIQFPCNKSRTPMEKRVEKCLKELNVPNAAWVLGRAGRFYQVSFCFPAGEKCEQMIQLLSENDIGVELNSTVSVLPCTLYYEGKEHTMTPNKTSPTLPQSAAASQMYYHNKEVTAWERFVNSVRARLMVAQVVSGVKENALFTFDFLILLIIASLTAAIGLVENSVVMLVASMLISPLMGPVMAGTFGFVTKDWKLQQIGVMNECFGLLLCVLIGFLYGLIISYLSWEVPDIIWPTPEMLNRGDIRSMWVGGLIALLSGAAVAIAVLGNYSGSLTGVAISASLMPPAVNAGLLWALALATSIMGEKPLNLNALKTGDPVRELITLGTLSLALTFLNIVCIFITGILVLKVKEVTPRGSKDYSRLLWKETIQIAKDYQYNLPQDAEIIEQGTSPNQYPQAFTQYLPRINMNQNTWSAYGAMPDLNRLTVQDLASMWHQLTVRPNVLQRPTHLPSTLNRAPTTPASPHMGQSLTRHWGAMSSLVTPYNSPVEPKDSPLCEEPSCKNKPKRFTVTPAYVDNDVF